VASPGKSSPAIPRGKQIEKLDPPNLSGAKATLAVPSYEYDAGLKTFQDIAKHKDELDGKIYGIEPGSSANAQIQKMIDTNPVRPGRFQAGAIERSRHAGDGRPGRPRQEVGRVPRLEPHPMNIQIKMNYLSGGDAVFARTTAKHVSTR